MQNLSLDNIGARWECPTCHSQLDWSYANIVDVGNPICENCDNDMDMELIEDSGWIYTE